MKRILLNVFFALLSFFIGISASIFWSIYNSVRYVPAPKTEFACPIVSNSDITEDFSVPLGWKFIEECKVSFYLPPDAIENKNVRGGDSCYREFKNKNIWVNLDVLYYTTKSDSIKDRYSKKDEFYVENIMLGDFPAEIIYFRENSVSMVNVYTAVLYVPRMIQGSSLKIWTSSRTPEERNNAVRIFQSVKRLNR